MKNNLNLKNKFVSIEEELLKNPHDKPSKFPINFIPESDDAFARELAEALWKAGKK
jgi:hypothetical protein